MEPIRSVCGVALVVLLLSGCGTSSTGTPGGDCSSDPSKCGCADDAQCAAPTPRCDIRTRGCVPCLPTSDNCPASMHCVNDGKQYSCVARDSCLAAVDCPVVDGKAGLCCSGKCADPVNDASNCGACGTACTNVMNGVGGCVNGACGITQCNSGFGNCDSKVANGCEADTITSNLHCGSCDISCKATPNTKTSCVASKCEFNCVQDFADCDGNPANGCETSTTTNPNACGGCGKVCAKLPNTTEIACVNNSCVVGVCQSPFIDCNHLPADGCESDPKSDPNNCSGCGRKCPAIDHGAAGCQNGNCGIGKCNPGFDDCDGNVLNGCEMDLSVDPNNCGACGKTCIVANGIATCQGAACVLQACNQGFADCDMNANNGCEVRTSTDAKHCGMCNNACPVPANATAQCSFGVCGVGSCMNGWADCDKDAKTGCEVSLNQVSNCGACGVMCAVPPNGVAACPAGACAIGMCNAGFADCDKVVLNGCEANLNTDGNNCSACGVVCVPKFNQAPTCIAAKCGLGGCLQGFADCNKNLVDGCEADVRADAKNCGACGNVCPQNAPFCTGGICNNILKSCLEYAKGGGQKSGVFTIDPDGAGPIAPFKVWCDMDMDGGGWTLALSKAVDASNPNVSGKSITWDCQTPSDPPLSPTDDIKTVLHFDNFAAIAPTDMLLMGGRRIIKFMYARPGGVPFVTNYRYLTERSCYEAMPIADAPCTGGTRSGCGHTNDACVTTDFGLWKIHDQGGGCFHDATNSHTVSPYCDKPNNCGSWGHCPGGSSSVPANAPNCWFYGGVNACGFPSITNCPQQSQAPWADYTPGTLGGFYNLWIR